MKTKEILKQALDYTKPVMWRIIGFDILQYLSMFISIGILTLIIGIISHITKNMKGFETITGIASALVSIALFIMFLTWPINAYVAKIKFITNQQNNKNPKFKELWKDSFKLNFKIIKIYLILAIICMAYVGGSGFAYYSIISHILGTSDMEIIFPILAMVLTITMIPLCPIILLSLISGTIINKSAASSILHSLKMVFCKSFFRLAIIPFLALLVPMLLANGIAGILNTYLVNAADIWQIVGSIIFFATFIFYLLSIFLWSVYLISYYLINFYDDQTNIESQSITTI